MSTDICAGENVPVDLAGACKVGQGLYVAGGRLVIAGTNEATNTNGCNNLGFDCASGEYWITGARGFAPLGSARWDAGTAGLGGGSTPISATLSPGGAARWTHGTATPLTITNPLPCTIGVLLGYDLSGGARTRADQVSYTFGVGAEWAINGAALSIHAAIYAGTPLMTLTPPAPITIFTPFAASANPLGNLSNEKVPAFTLAPGDTATVNAFAFHAAAGTPNAADQIDSYASAVRCYGYIV